jgi:hypothetical protein
MSEETECRDRVSAIQRINVKKRVNDESKSECSGCVGIV